MVALWHSWRLCIVVVWYCCGITCLIQYRDPLFLNSRSRIGWVVHQAETGAGELFVGTCVRARWTQLQRETWVFEALLLRAVRIRTCRLHSRDSSSRYRGLHLSARWSH